MKTHQYKSKLEAEISKVIQGNYEEEGLPYLQPEVKRTYTPDWKIGDKIYVEAKGKLDLETRKKMLWVKEQYPDCKFYLVFQRASNKITKRSKTTYGDWATANGFEWHEFDGTIPDHWYGEHNANNKNSKATNRRRSNRKSK